MLNKIKRKFTNLRRDVSGVTMIEYSILIGIITAAIIGIIVLVGGWVGTQWNALWAALQGAGAS